MVFGDHESGSLLFADGQPPNYYKGWKPNRPFRLHTQCPNAFKTYKDIRLIHNRKIVDVLSRISLSPGAVKGPRVIGLLALCFDNLMALWLPSGYGKLGCTLMLPAYAVRRDKRFSFLLSGCLQVFVGA